MNIAQVQIWPTSGIQSPAYHSVDNKGLWRRNWV